MNPLDANELWLIDWIALSFQAHLNRLSHSNHQFVERLSLRMAAAEFRDCGDVVALGIALNDDVEFTLGR